jgi:hypothetical protein
MRIPLLALLASLFATTASAATFGVEGTGFVVETAPGERLTSRDLVGAVFEIADGAGGMAKVLAGADFEIADGAGGMAKVRIDAVAPAQERSGVLLHTFSVIDPATGAATPLCDPDAHGRRAGFPLKGRWDGRRFVADDSVWFLTCASGSQGKCVLWGYDPWGRAPDGRPLADFYQACQQMVRADYEGKGQPHTRNGTLIDVADVADIQTHATRSESGFGFEAGWGVDGAVCVARTRIPELLTREALVAGAPRLAGPCDEAVARARGALLFTRIATQPKGSLP